MVQVNASLISIHYGQLFQMKKKFGFSSCSVFISLFLLLAAGEVSAQKGAYFMANGKKIRIDSFNREVNHILKEVGVPGLSLAVIDDNQVVFFNAYGYKDEAKKDAVNKETIFEACSLSKSFLVFAVMRLATEGKIDLDKPMYQYLAYEPLEHDARYKLITTRMVLSHSSGIENWKYENNPDSLEILSDPGTRSVYSGEGYQYLAKVVALITKMPYDAYMKEWVFDPLKLKRTFGHYTDSGAYPINYANGHSTFGKQYEKQKNLSPVPASGVQTTALDYATLITAFFNKQYLSDKMRRNVLTPAIRSNDHDPPMFFGPGFQLLFDGGDTLVSFGGNNTGFKAGIFYSVTQKSGLVFLSNGDLGKLMATSLTHSGTGMDVGILFKDDYYEQYPSKGLALFSTYRQNGEKAMLADLKKLKEQTGGKIGMNTLNHLADMLASGGEISLAKMLSEENIKLYPESSQAYYLLGEIHLYEKNYKLAYANLRKAKDLLYSDDPGIDYDIKRCAEMIAEKKEPGGN